MRRAERGPAINARGDRIVAWMRSGRIEARIRNAGHAWGAVIGVAKAPSVPNTSLRVAVAPGCRPGPAPPSGPPDLLTPAGATGIAGPAVSYQTTTGQRSRWCPVIQGNSGGYVAAVQAP